MYRRCPTLFRRSRVKLLSGMQLVRHMWKAWDHSKPQKIVFGEDTVEFAGFEITRDIVRPSNRPSNRPTNSSKQYGNFQHQRTYQTFVPGSA